MSQRFTFDHKLSDNYFPKSTSPPFCNNYHGLEIYALFEKRLKLLYIFLTNVSQRMLKLSSSSKICVSYVRYLYLNTVKKSLHILSQKLVDRPFIIELYRQKWSNKFISCISFPITGELIACAQDTCNGHLNAANYACCLLSH